MSRKQGAAQPQLRDLLRVPVDTGASLDLVGVDTAGTPGLPEGLASPQDWAAGEVADLGGRLAGLQERLAAAAKTGGDPRRLLVVLQAMDCGGKDGTIKHVVGLMNPIGIKVVSFGVPSVQERRHHYLWRIRRGLPQVGEIGVFNRSYYEDVLVARVEELVEPEAWAKRYDEINRFEARLSAGGVRLVKVMLHISRAEQGRRLLERIDDPTKRWKYRPGDVDARARWSDYQQAYGDALGRCSTSAAPWYVVPADHKWYRNWAVSTLLAETLAELDPHYPEPSWDPETERRRVRDSGGG